MSYVNEVIECGIIARKPTYGPEDHGIFTCMISIDYENGGTQGFGGLVLGKSTEGETELAKDFVKSLCETFRVQTLSQLVGKKCRIIKLAAEGCGFNDNIDGLESIDTGKRFMIQDWRKKHFPQTLSVLEEKIKRAKDRIEYLKRDLRHAELDLFELEQLR